MDIVLGVSMAPTTVRLVLIEGASADGVTVEQDDFEVAGAADSASSASDQVIAAITGTREGAVEGGYQLTSTGVTWTDPAEVGALRDKLAAGDVGSVMLVSPLLAAAALAQTVGDAMGYEHIAMLLVDPGHATLAIVEVGDGSIVDLHRQPLENARQSASQGAIAAELAVMLAGLDARRSRADGVFLIGCGADIVSIKPALEAATSLDVSAPEEPDMALARGAALASANAPLFASSTAALAYALDPGTGEVNPHALIPTYLDISANADLGEGGLAYSALDDQVDDRDDKRLRRRMPVVLAGTALAAVCAIVAGVLMVLLASDVRPSSALQSPRGNVVTPAKQAPTPVPAQTPAQLPAPPQAQLPAPSSAPAAPIPEAAAPPAPPPAKEQPPNTPVNMPPATPIYRAPTPRVPQAVPAPVQRAPAPAPAAPAPPPPAAVPAPPPAAPVVPARPPLTMYLHFPFVTIPIPINPPPPPAPPPAPAP